ncbi:PREDICTED: serine hydrolase-like protein [Wasmannia auropunctata]|uniref:serine hydrolase-like protein n=1 Tax=Wasmannia auropunctata TaxID=64793 RepID=UPI0005EEF5B9|nr:PREDICTED: serine hydrolase-like protein [Wasmannia auropunctata]XP_011707785.1 PREDICTED: serine hydrolase-like protein [Wasmannia auropunctata]XP_011707794.1 PREDICTED: serine hydrolase-like protein [Wasmannia auropunctata]
MAEVKQHFTEIKLTVPWGHVAARTYGSSTGKPVLVVHGRLDNAGSFTRLMQYLPKELFYYVCIDLPGHGWSSHFPPWMVLDSMDYAHALYFILEALQWKTCIYIGHSMGAQIAILFSILQPNRIEKLIAIDGILVKPEFIKEFTTYLEIASASSVKAYHKNEEPSSFTKEEILHALKNMRFGALNSEAADAMFDRAVTKVNGKYIYNRDIRLKNNPFTYMNTKEFKKINNTISIPIHLIAPSQGVFFPFIKDPALEILKGKTLLDVIIVNGNHDVHNNNPENIAPFICKILNNYSSKL